MPIHTWVIEHPEGIIVIDTGETVRATQRGYHQGGDAIFYGSFLHFALTAEYVWIERLSHKVMVSKKA